MLTREETSGQGSRSAHLLVHLGQSPLLLPQTLEDPSPQEPSAKGMQRGKETRLLVSSEVGLALNPTPYADGVEGALFRSSEAA